MVQKRDAATGTWFEVVEYREGVSSPTGTGSTTDVSSLSKESTQLSMLSKLDIQTGHTERLLTIQQLLEQLQTLVSNLANKTDTQNVAIVSGGSTGGASTTDAATETTLIEIRNRLIQLPDTTDIQNVNISGGPTSAKQDTIIAGIGDVVSQLIDISKKTDIQPVSSDSIETILSSLLTSINNLADKTETQPVMVSNTTLATSDRQDNQLTAIQALTKPSDLQNVVLPNDSYDVGFTRTTSTGTIANGFSSIVISNTGEADGNVKGTVLKSGESLPLVAPLGSTINGFNYDASGTEFVIVTSVKSV